MWWGLLISLVFLYPEVELVEEWRLCGSAKKDLAEMRMASCERTGSYVGAYSDKSFPATKSKYPVLAELGHSKRTTPPSRMMLGGVALNPDSAIPRWLFVCIERAKVQ